jgi:hypothetical protein
MADRIFPSAEKDTLGSAKQINTIDWAKFAQTLNIKLAADEAPKEEKEEVDVENMTDGALESAIKKHMPAGDDIREFCKNCPSDEACKPHCDEWLSRNEEEEKEESEEDNTATAGNLDKLKGGLKEFMKNKMKKNAPKDAKDADKNAEPMKRKAKECEACGKAYSGAKCGCTAKTAGKIVFNNPEEISAEALMQAKTAGNEQLVRAILAAREDRNRIIEARLEALASEETEKTQKIAARRANRANIVAQAKTTAERLAAAEAKSATKNDGFKNVEAMGNSEKRIVAQRLIDNGFPAEYVEATLGMNNTVVASVTAEEEQIREIMSSSLNSSTKRTAVASFVKVAELSQEQLDRCIRFWVDELGYGDEEWVRDLFAKK